MNWRHLVGSKVNATETWLLSRPWFPLFGTWALKKNWLYDICRFTGGRNVKILFDVGANIGQTALDMVRFFPAAQIHCFEPVTSTYEVLRESCRPYPYITPHRLGLSATPGELRIRLQQDSVFNSLRFAVPESSSESIDTEMIELSTVSDFCSRYQIKELDVLKTDAQGYDLEVIKGALPLIKERRIPFVYSEVCFDPTDPNNQNFEEFHSWMRQHGFSLCGFYEQHNWGERRAILGHCNALYVSRDALSRR